MARARTQSKCDLMTPRPGKRRRKRSVSDESAAAKNSRCGQWLIRSRAEPAQEDGEVSGWEARKSGRFARAASLQHDTATWSTMSSMVCSAASGAGAALLHQWLWREIATGQPLLRRHGIGCAASGVALAATPACWTLPNWAQQTA